MNQEYINFQKNFEVIIIQRIVPHYRVKFFRKLYQKLKSFDIKLTLLYGFEIPGTVPKGEFINELWATSIKNKYFRLFDNEVVWQSGCLKYLKNADLVIIEQANRLLLNYPILLFGMLGYFRVGFWGHGKNMQEVRKNTIRERIKKCLIKCVDWWFAYTNLSVEIVEKCGFSPQKITNVMNTIDTAKFENDLAAIDRNSIEYLKFKMGDINGRFFLYCGGLYDNKKLNFLLESCFIIKENHPEFHLLVIGDGPEKAKILQASMANSWIHFLGPKYDKEKALYFKASEALLIPGLVGLAIIDSFVANCPIITTDIPIHSPEIAYLNNNINGFMTKYDVHDYADKVSEVLENPKALQRIALNCLKSGKLYNIDAMVNNYVDGIQCCLKTYNGILK